MKMSKAFSVIVWCSLLLLCSAASLETSVEIDVNIDPSYADELVIHRNRRDIVDWIQQTINNTISNLVEAANRINNITTAISNGINEAVTGALDNINNVTQTWIENVEKAIANATGSAIAIGEITKECIERNQDAAYQIANDTRDNLQTCLQQTAFQYTELLSDGSKLSESAKELGESISGEVRDCFVVNSTVELTPCLIAIITDNISTASNLMNQISIFITRSILATGFLPIRVSGCVTSAIGSASREIGKIIAAIPKCVSDQTQS